MQARDLEALAAADVFATHLIVAAHHIGLRLGKAGAIPLIGIALQRCLLATHQPGDLVLPGLAAVGAGQRVGALLRPLIKKSRSSIETHPCPRWQVPRHSKVFHTDEGLGQSRVRGRSAETMAKKKQEKFSVTKAVKRNARDRVGQPKPEKVIPSEPQQTRQQRRHKETLVDLLQREE